MNASVVALRTIGDITVDLETCSVSAGRGAVTIGRQLTRVVERLLRRPGILVSTSDLIAAMYPPPEDEADHADVRVRQQMVALRALLMTMSNSVEVRTERHVGYALIVVRR